MSVHTWQGLLFISVLTGQPVCVSTKDSLLDKREAVHSPTLSDFQKVRNPAGEKFIGPHLLTVCIHKSTIYQYFWLWICSYFRNKFISYLFVRTNKYQRLEFKHKSKPTTTTATNNNNNQSDYYYCLLNSIYSCLKHCVHDYKSRHVKEINTTAEGKHSHAMEEAHLRHLYPRSHSFGSWPWVQVGT